MSIENANYIKYKLKVPYYDIIYIENDDNMTTKKKRKKRLRLRYEGVKFLTYFIFFLLLFIYTITNSIKVYSFYQYKKTDEYKIRTMGYSLEETKDFLKIINDDIKEFLLTNPKEDIYYSITQEKYFLPKNYIKYIEYQKSNQSLPLKDIIAMVNVHSSEGWYNNTYKTDMSKKNLILVNKFYQLEEGYERDDLVKIPLQYAYDDNKAAKEVVDKYIEMHKKVKEKLGVHLMVNSSFRSYEEQNEIYKSFRSKGEAYADAYAARPGFSEHQTGLAIDITSTAHPYTEDFKESEEFEWLKNNCYKYGFILRYPEEKEKITGYSTESWHFRYVGVENATKIFKEGITLDEYYAYFIEK